MPINFVQLLQDSWNFMRNQSQFVLFGVILLVVLQLASFFLSPQMNLSPQELQNDVAFEQAFAAQLPSMIISGLISVFVNVLIVLNIKSINNGTYRHFFQNLGEVAKRLFPALSLTILMVLPLSVAVSFGAVGLSGGASLLVLPLMITGIFIFLKLCLVLYAYLIEEPQKTVGESVKFVWAMSRGKMRILFLFCVLSFLVPSLLGGLLGNMVGGEIGGLISQIFGAVLSLFMVIFAFRFYQAFRALPTV